MTTFTMQGGGGADAPIRTNQQMVARQLLRHELEGQIQAITSQRGRLVQEQLNASAAGNQTVAKEYTSQIAELGERLNRLHRQKLQTDDAITDAMSRGIGPGAPNSEGLFEALTEATAAQAAQAQAQAAAELAAQQAQGIAVPPHQPDWLQVNAERLLVGEALGFLLIGVVIWQTLGRRRRAPELQAQSVDQLRQAVDAIAVEVERISENQRYVTKLISEGKVREP